MDSGSETCRGEITSYIPPSGSRALGSIRLQGSNCHAQSATSPHSRREPSASQPFPERPRRLARLAAELCQVEAAALEEISKYYSFSLQSTVALRVPTKGWLKCGLEAGDGPLKGRRAINALARDLIDHADQ